MSGRCYSLHGLGRDRQPGRPKDTAAQQACQSQHDVECDDHGGCLPPLDGAADVAHKTRPFGRTPSAGSVSSTMKAR